MHARRSSSSNCHRSGRTPDAKRGRQGNKADTPPPPRYPPNPPPNPCTTNSRHATQPLLHRNHRKKKNPIKRRARLLPRRRSSFSYTEKPSPTRLRAKNRLHTRPKSFPLHRRLPTQQQLVERVVAGRPVYTQESQEKHFSLSSSISKNQR
jgi:hypothetical protein